ncbi:MAG TPA: DUF3352 domain-containing protein, partial [Blastocatellia bacterium]|nr:DUF3352 domain-containing protein [Blastocatellia bacterium]
FYSETIFFYIDLALSARVAKERQEAMQKHMEDSGDGLRKDAEAEGRLDEFERPEAQRNSSGRTPPPEMASPATPLAVNERPAPAPVEESPAPAPEPESASQTAPDKKLAGAKAAPPSTSAAAAVNAASTSSKPAPPAQGRGRRAGESLEISVDPTLAPPPPPPPAAPQESRGGGSDHLMGLLDMIITRSLRNTSTPDAAALALTLENDSLILRALVVTGQGTAFGPIPFIPILVSGPAQASGAASYMPADTDIFITASLDLPRLYDTALGMFGMLEDSSSSRAQKSKEPSLESKVAAFEKANGFKIRDEIAATLGSEIAVGIPARYLNATPIARVPLSPQSSQSGLLFLVSVRDKEALRSKLRPVLEAVGLKSPNEKGLTEKRGDIEINSYSGVSIAFIDSYLVIGSDAAAIRRVLDARAKNETLATSRDFHSYMQWQPRETLAQAYVSGTILKDLFRNPSTLDSRYDEEGRRFLARFNFEPEPITYLAASDVLGPLYELRVPKNLLKRVFAEMAVDELRMGVVRNESAAKNILGMLSEMEKSYKTEHGRYATLEELEGFEQFKEYLQSGGYKIDLSVSGNRYEATMTPTEYGKTGRLSFYLDQSGVVREGDHGGGRATAADKKSDSDN